MTTKEFLEMFVQNVEADIGDGELSPSCVEHLAAIFEDVRTEAHFSMPRE